MIKRISVILCLLIFICAGCGTDSKNTSTDKKQTKTSATDILNKPLTKSELEDLKRDSEKYLLTHPDNINHKLKIKMVDFYLKNGGSPSEQQIINDVENLKNELKKQAKEEADAKAKQAKQEQAQIFQYSNFTLQHNYNPVLPYNGIKMSFVVQNVSNSQQTLRLSDFVLKKQGSNTILPQKALRKYTGIARNPDNPDFSDYDRDLNQREMYPGDRFLVKIEFWEQHDIIRSLEGWQMFHNYQNNMKAVVSLHD